MGQNILQKNNLHLTSHQQLLLHVIKRMAFLIEILYLTSSNWHKVIAHTSLRWAWVINRHLERGRKNEVLLCGFLIVEMTSWQASHISLFKPTCYLMLTFSKAAMSRWVSIIRHYRSETSQTHMGNWAIWGLTVLKLGLQFHKDF